MKLLYIADCKRRRDIGVYHKIMDQLEGFRYYGIDARLVGVSNDKKSKWRNICIKQDIDVLYIRYPMSDFSFICFLRKFKKERSLRKIIIELPTYPYEGEERLDNIISILKDRIFRKFLRFYVDRIVTFSLHPLIFGIKTIRSVNGLDFSQITIKKCDDKLQKSIDLIAVATMKMWHGYERIIEGLNIYYSNGGKHDIRLHLVGIGPEINKYKKLTKQYHLENYIVFHGQKEGRELDAVYDICDIGLVGFGYHRTGISLLSSIKTREYVAKGLPMVIAGRVDVLPAEKYDFVLEEPADETPINIEEMIKWYGNLVEKCCSKELLTREIRRVSLKKCDSKIVMKKLCRFLYGRNYEAGNL